MNMNFGVRLTVINEREHDDEDTTALLRRTRLTALSSLVVPCGLSVSNPVESEPSALRVDGSVYSTCVERRSLLETLDDIDDIVKALSRRESRKP